MNRCGESPQQREQLLPTPGVCIARGNHRHRQRPSDRKIGVVVGDGEVGLGIVRPVDPVADVRRRRQRLEAVQEPPRRNVQVTELVVVEHECPLRPESRRSRPDIDEHVVDGAVRAPHQLRLPPVARSSVHTPPYDTTDGTGLGILNERCGRTRSAEVFVEDRGIERAGEEPAVVPGRLRYKNQDIGQVRLLDAHEEIVP